MWAILLFFIALVFLGIWSTHQGLKPRATLIYSCLKEGHQYSEKEARKVPVFLISAAILISTEVLIYCRIVYDLYTHNKVMRLVLREETMKKRLQQNVINLTGHICQFILKMAWLLMIFLSMKAFDSFVHYGPAVFAMAQQVLNPMLHIAMSPTMRAAICKIYNNVKSIFLDQFSSN